MEAEAVWRVQRLQGRERVLDFNASGRGTRAVLAVDADGACLANAASLLDLSRAPGRLQVQLCEDCGVTGCNAGGWICSRRLGDAVLWLPCFEDMISSAGDLTAYTPPAYARGFPLFDRERYGALRRHIPRLPTPDECPPLRAREALRLLQLCAPGGALGRFPAQPRLAAGAVVACGGDDLAGDLRAFEAALEEAWEGNATLGECPATAPVSFFVDLPGTPTWTPFARQLRATVLHLGDHTSVSPDVPP